MKIVFSEAKGKENSKVIAGNKGANVRKPGASDLCCHLDKKVGLLECLTFPVVWQ